MHFNIIQYFPSNINEKTVNFKFLSSIVDSSYISKSAPGAVSYNFSPVYILCTSTRSCIQEIPEAMVCPTSSSIVDSSYISKSAPGAVSYNFSPVYILCTSTRSCIQEIPEAMVCPTSSDILLYPSPDASLLLQKVLLQKSPDDLPGRIPSPSEGTPSKISG